MYLGIDYEHNEEYRLYFNMLYRIIKLGIELNKKTIELGQTCYYPKLKLGSRLKSLFMYIKFRNPILHKLFSPFMNGMFPKIYSTDD